MGLGDFFTSRYKELFADGKEGGVIQGTDGSFGQWRLTGYYPDGNCKVEIDPNHFGFEDFHSRIREISSQGPISWARTALHALLNGESERREFFTLNSGGSKCRAVYSENLSISLKQICFYGPKKERIGSISESSRREKELTAYFDNGNHMGLLDFFS